MTVLREIALNDARIVLNAGETEFRICNAEGKEYISNASGYVSSRFPASELAEWVKLGFVRLEPLESRNDENVYRVSPELCKIFDFLQKLNSN